LTGSFISAFFKEPDLLKTNVFLSTVPLTEETKL
jgi:hypothetical protein